MLVVFPVLEALCSWSSGGLQRCQGFFFFGKLRLGFLLGAAGPRFSPEAPLSFFVGREGSEYRPQPRCRVPSDRRPGGISGLGHCVSQLIDSGTFVTLGVSP